MGRPSPLRLERAETVIYLDFPIRLCLWRLMRRIALGYGRTRSDMTEECPERFDAKFILYVIDWNYGPGPRTEAALGDFSGNLVRLRSPKVLAHWLFSIKA